jgi:Luciferase-like monooxygenase
MAAGKTPCGIAIPQVFSDTAVDINLIQQFVQKAETLGYDSLWVQESIVGNVPVLEPLSLLTYAAALTSRLRLGTSVMLTVLRNPVQLAKLVSSLDQLSQGRLTVGIGIGGHVPEAIFGLPSGQPGLRCLVRSGSSKMSPWNPNQCKSRTHLSGLERARLLLSNGPYAMGMAGWALAHPPRQIFSSSTACCGVSWTRRNATRLPSRFPSGSISLLITTAAALSVACVSGSACATATLTWAHNAASGEVRRNVRRSSPTSCVLVHNTCS